MLEMVASSATPDPAYAPETRAAGWKFDIDTTRARQSDTWTLAAPEIRPWLLMLWVTAWDQSPVGTLPADDDLVAAIIGMSPALFVAHRKVLLRGWYRCSDGRLYHKVITELVLAMIIGRRKDRERQAQYRSKLLEKQEKHASVTRESRVSHALVTPKTPTGPGPGPVPGPTSKSKTPLGSRLASDWRIPEEWIAWTLEAYTELDRPKVIRMSLEFRDYWIAVPGSRGRKVDWLATWRNRVRTKLDG